MNTNSVQFIRRRNFLRGIPAEAPPETEPGAHCYERHDYRCRLCDADKKYTADPACHCDQSYLDAYKYNTACIKNKYIQIPGCVNRRYDQVLCCRVPGSELWIDIREVRSYGLYIVSSYLSHTFWHFLLVNVFGKNFHHHILLQKCLMATIRIPLFSLLSSTCLYTSWTHSLRAYFWALQISML